MLAVALGVAVYVSAAVAAGVELFATRVRYSGFSIGYNICVAAFGGTTPYVVTGLPRRQPTAWRPPTTSSSQRSCHCSPS